MSCSNCFCVFLACWMAALLGGCSEAPNESGEGLGGAEATVGPTAADASDQVAGQEASALSAQDAGEVADAAVQSGPVDLGDLIAAKRWSEAESQLRGRLLSDPTSVVLLFQLAQVYAAQSQFESAVETLDLIPVTDPQAGLPALGQSADWCFQAERFGEAERRFVKLVELVPDVGMARRKLAFLLNRQGRRHEAAVHTRHLCRLGDITQTELHSLMVLSDAIFDSPDQVRPDNAGEPMYFPIGAGGIARKQFTDRDFAGAAASLRPLVSTPGAHPALQALYGRSLSEHQAEQEFLQWVQGVPESVQAFSEYWAGVGAYWANQREFGPAIAALGRAVDLDPTDMLSARRLNQCLEAVGRQEDSNRWSQRIQDANAMTELSNRIGAGGSLDSELFEELSAKLLDFGRPLEALLWETVGAIKGGATKAEIAALNERRLEILQGSDAFPGASSRLLGLDVSKFPMRDLPIQRRVVVSGAADVIATVPPQFAESASLVGLDHTYAIAEQPQGAGFSIYQAMGGGVVVLDFDLDGWADLYLAQGAVDAPGGLANQSNQLYRNAGEHSGDVATAARVEDFAYTVGVTAGDLDQDGFLDLVVGNVGATSLLMNNGDGTFSLPQVFRIGEALGLTSSMAVADVSGDGSPDVVNIVYVDDVDLFRRPSQRAGGQREVFSPLDFSPGADVVMLGDGKGSFEKSVLGGNQSERHAGLGVVIAELDGVADCEVFVGNDVYPNDLWKVSTEDGQWSNSAALRGCAYGFGGYRTASMGIAAGDFDRSGTLDLHVANFQQEFVSLFLNQGGAFKDCSAQFGLDRDSRAKLGFGCQAIDFDNNGWQDLVVANGHIDEVPGGLEPFKQLPQAFVNLGTKFELADANKMDAYFSTGHLGRAVATLDFNNDGRTDYVVTHIEESTALLVNQTESENQWLGIRLVGTLSERDAIGARVVVKAGARDWTHWVTAGDGYLAKNDCWSNLGLGSGVDSVDLEVHWPSGQSQLINGIDVNQRVLIVEGMSSFVVN